MLVGFARMIKKAQEFSDAGVPCRTVTAIVTDGADMGSHASPNQVASLAKDMLKTESHVIIGVGVNDGQTDFQHVFESCGIPSNWILTVNNTPSEFRKAFGIVSKSAQKMSQPGMTAANFSSQSSAGISSLGGGMEWDDSD